MCIVNAVSAIIIRESDDAVYIGKRSYMKKISPGLWETIGGKILEGETPEKALLREIKEELNCEINHYIFFKLYTISKTKYYVYIVTLKKEPLFNKIDFEDAGWFHRNEISDLDFALNCKERIIEYWKIKQ
jgi:8-oxo-dGTP diphosphatase